MCSSWPDGAIRCRRRTSTSRPRSWPAWKPSPDRPICWTWQWNALAWNAAAADLFIGWLDPPAPSATCCAACSCRRACRHWWTTWPHRAARLVAEFRAHSIRHAEDPPTRALVEGLITESQVFRKDWLSAGRGRTPGRPPRLSAPSAARAAALRAAHAGAGMPRRG
ncbi:MmyB family transcriptional regulator [Cupriavidus basilensis]